MMNRRSFLGGLSAAFACTSLSFSRQARAATTLPISIVNSTGRYANDAIWVYIVGTEAGTGRQLYSRGNGVATPIALSDNGPDGYTDYAIPLRSSGSTPLTLPNMAGRIYFAIGQKLKFRVVVAGDGRPGLQYPAGWVSGDPNYNILHDFLEFNFTTGGMYCNTTMVDQFSIPLSIQLDGARSQNTGSVVPGGRDRIFSGIAAQSAFSRLVVGDKLRVIAPGHGINAGIFSSTYFDGYVNDVWNKYAGTNLSVKINTTTYTGRVSGGSLVFDGGVRTFAKPSTRDIFFCNGALDAGGQPSGAVAAVLGAAFNRSTLRDYPSQPTTSASTFYQQAVTNHYSKVLHANTSNGKAYGFPFDDVVDFASYIQDEAPRSATFTLTGF
ncbi:beta-1,3-glucanase family protein [Pendulispora rubella]|uniref:Beta-1,3-glucanase family protein n=1 Tax=Pendulispora rubella TaxID=2741070 RepID=A0ABZ2L5F1_9BACT